MLVLSRHDGKLCTGARGASLVQHTREAKLMQNATNKLYAEPLGQARLVGVFLGKPWATRGRAGLPTCWTRLASLLDTRK